MVNQCDRRRFPRVTAQRACKVYDPRSRRYTAGHTVDLSRCGLQLELDREVPVRPGDELLVALAHRSTPTLLTRTDFATARVVRVAADGACVAVEMKQPAELGRPATTHAA